MIDDLYSVAILNLAASVPRIGRLERPDGSAERVSKVCGSRVIVDIVLDGDLIIDFAQEVQACALGQAAASILGAEAVGATACEIELARDALRALLIHGAAFPNGRFSALTILAPVQGFPARHASTLLAFDAASKAIRAAVARRTRQQTLP